MIKFEIGDRIKWKNTFGIHQHGKVEALGVCFGFIGVRRHAPEDSEGLPNDTLLWIETNKLERDPEKNLYLIEFYTNSETGVSGWEINFAWVFAPNMEGAKHKLALHQGRRFDCVISASIQARIVPLAGDFRVNTPDANLFILD